MTESGKVLGDILKRVLLYNKYKVKHVMNITDVGHLTDDADQGEDKIENAKKLIKTLEEKVRMIDQSGLDE